MNETPSIDVETSRAATRVFSFTSTPGEKKWGGKASGDCPI
jgi:hypothetical protein